MKNRFRLPLSVALLVLTLSASLLAQSDRGTITGTVSDSTGAVVPEAALSLKHADTGVVYEGRTTATGNYTLAELPAGNYELTVVRPGFRKYVQSGITVLVATTSRVDVVLQVGAATETVTVTSSAPLLKTESAEQSFNITGDEVNALPLTQGSAGLRNPIAFALLNPSVNVPSSSNLQMRVNGMPDNTYRSLVDGQDTTNSIDPTHLSETQPSMEALQEVQLSTSNFSAEFGRVAGGLVNLTSRSGTNAYHGSGYDYLTNEALGAGQPLTNAGNNQHSKPRNRSQDFGFSVGGPVWLPKIYNGKDKTFFFFNLEQWRSTVGTSGTFTTVPTNAYRTGDFSAARGVSIQTTDPNGNPLTTATNTIYDPLTDQTINGKITRTAFPGNIIPASRIDPIAAKIQALIPAPTNSALINNFAVVDANTTIKTVPSIKIDENVGSQTKFSFYWSEWRQDRNKNTLDGLPWPVSPARIYIDRTPTYRLNIDRTITPTLLVHVGAGVVHYIHTDSAPPSVLTYDAVKSLGLVGASVTPSGFPQITGLSAAVNGGMASGVGPTNAGTYHNDKPTTVGSVTWIRGDHSFRAGGEWEKDIWANISSGGTYGTYAFAANQTALPYLNTTTVSGNSLGFPYASFLLGDTNSTSISNFQDAQWRKHNFGFYLQDTWRVNRKLTLDYGLRWDYQTAYQEIYSRNSEFAPNLPNPAAGGLLGATQYEGYGAGRCNCSFTKTYPYALGPRLGIAWQFLPKTVLRAGWGLVYGTTAVVNYQLGGALGTGFNTITNTNPAFAEPASQLQNGLSYSPAALFAATLDPGIRPLPGQINSPGAYEDPNGGRPGRINQWNISLQREISKDLLVEAAYVGNRAVWLQADGLVDFNVLSAARLASFGLNVNSAATQNLLNSPLNSAAVVAAGFKAPYAGFPLTSTLAQALRPYPQFAGLGGRWEALGDSWYDALQTKVTKRMGHGLTATWAFTWQKELNLGAGGLGAGIVSTPVNDILNRDQNKYISADSQPLETVFSFSYQAPPLTSNRWIRAVERDWTFGGVFRYASGLPIQAPAAQNNLSTILFRGTFADRVPGQPLFLEDPNCHCIDPNKSFILNPAAWTQPPAGQFGTAAAYYNDYRYARRPVESMSMGRLFRIREHMSLQIRAEFFNVFNRLQLNNPTATNSLLAQTTNSAGVPTSGFGYINPTSVFSPPRTGQLVGRFQF
jgi:hypothetical protein